MNFIAFFKAFNIAQQTDIKGKCDVYWTQTQSSERQNSNKQGLILAVAKCQTSRNARKNKYHVITHNSAKERGHRTIYIHKANHGAGQQPQ